MPGEQAFLLAGFFLLLTAAGWSIRYLWEKDRPREPGQYLNVEYLKGLNFLLNEQTDQAVDLFLRMVRVDDETIETHFALGSLFRRRGEVNRAIRIHQNIIARPNLPEEQKDEALFALAKDYLRAGLLDRAESLFKTISEKPDYEEEGLSYLCRIYEQEREWSKAIEAGTRLERIRGEPMALTVAHYHCELAQQALADNNFAEARRYLRDAQAGRVRTMRGALARAALAAGTNDKELALKLYRRAIGENLDLIVEALPRMAAIHADAGTGAALDRELADLVKRRPEASAIIAYTAILDRDLTGPTIDTSVENYILSEPTLQEFIDVDALVTGEESRAAAIARIKEGLHRLAQKTPKYRCTECGFSSMNLLWQCPSCKSWETQRPANKVRFDTLVRGNEVEW